MSRSWRRVTSPVPGRSTFSTSAPNQASNCVQAGPAWTPVKSMILIPLRGRLMAVAPDGIAGILRGGAAFLLAWNCAASSPGAASCPLVVRRRREFAAERRAVLVERWRGGAHGRIVIAADLHRIAGHAQAA